MKELGFIDIVEIRFILALVLVFITSLYRKRTFRTNFIMSFIILYIAFGLKNTCFALFSVLINLIIIKFKLLNTYTGIILNIINIYLYKTVGKIIEPRIKGTFDITGFLMVLTVKIGYLLKFNDMNFKNIIDYIFFIPGILTGPTTSYVDFLNRNVNLEMRFPTQQFLVTIGFGVLHAFMKKIDFFSKIVDEKQNLITRLINLFLFNFTGRTKFYFAWYFAHICFMMNNLPNHLNISFRSVEFCESVSEIASNWNRFVNQWLKELIFKPLMQKSKTLAILISFSTSAALHGFNLCYFIFTLSFAAYSNTIKRTNTFIKYKFLRIIQMMGFVSYFSMPFYLLNVRILFNVWKNVYFFGHVYCTGLLILYKVIDMRNANIKPIENIVEKKTVNTKNLTKIKVLCYKRKSKLNLINRKIGNIKVLAE